MTLDSTNHMQHKAKFGLPYFEDVNIICEIIQFRYLHMLVMQLLGYPSVIRNKILSRLTNL